MPFTTPSDRATGYLVTDTVYNDEIVGNIAYMATDAPRCHLYHNTTQTITANQSITSGGVTLLFNSEYYDNATMHDTSSLTNRITIPAAGLYLIGWRCVFAAFSAATGAQGAVRLNGSNSTMFCVAQSYNFDGGTIDVDTLIVGGSQPFAFSTADVAGGAYIEVRVTQMNSGSGSRASGDATDLHQRNEFWCHWIGTAP